MQVRAGLAKVHLQPCPQCFLFLTLSVFYTLGSFPDVYLPVIPSLNTRGTRPTCFWSISLQITLPRGTKASITSINTLSGDLLLKIFYHSQPVLLDEDGDDDDDTVTLEGKWDSERWWYKLAHVCQKWRDLMLSSAPHMGLSIVCSYGTPVADILAHSPSLPLIIDYGDEDREVTPEDELGILCALRNPLQVRRIRLCVPVLSLQRLVAAIEGEFPKLEHLYIKPLTDNNSGLSFPETFKAPQLRHVRLRNITYPPAPSCSLSPNFPVQPAKQIGEWERGNSPQPSKWVPLSLYSPVC